MATSGQIQTNTAFGHIRLAWSTRSQSVDNNWSFVDYTLSIYRSGNIESTAQKSYSIVINGLTVASGTTTIGGSGTKIIRSGTTTISHNADGTKIFNLSFSQQIDIIWGLSWVGTVTGSGSGTLDTIPRVTTPVLSDYSPYIDGYTQITLNRASPSFTHDLTYTFGSLSGTIGTGVGTSISWTIPSSFAAQIPSSTSGTGTIICKTYNGSTLVGSKSISFTANLPTSDVPSISSVSITEAVSGLAAKIGAFVQNQSKLNVAINASPSSGGSIATYLTYIQGVPYNQQSFESNMIFASGNIGVNVTVKDSRGKTVTLNNTISVLPYSQPIISKFNAYRANSSGTAKDDGTYLKVEFSFAITALNNRNDKSYTIEYKATSSDSWTALTSSTSYYSRSNASFTSNSAVLSVDSAYDVRITVTDYFGSTVSTMNVSTAFTLMDFNDSGKGLAFGKVSEKDRLEIAMDTDLTSNVRIYAPTSDAADGAYLRLLRSDGSVAAFIASSTGGDGLNIRQYSDDALSGTVTLTPTGGISTTGEINTSVKPRFMDWGIMTHVSQYTTYVSFRKIDGVSVFTQPPHVVVTAYGNDIGQNHMFACNVGSCTKDEFTVFAKDVIGNATECNVMWFAIGF